MPSAFRLPPGVGVPFVLLGVGLVVAGGCGKTMTYFRTASDAGGPDLTRTGTGGMVVQGSGGSGTGGASIGGSNESGGVGGDTRAGGEGGVGGSGANGSGGQSAAGGATGGSATGGSNSGGAGTGGGGGAGTGGGGGGTVLSCAAPVPPMAGAVTDFSDWNVATQRFGSPGGIVGTIFSYAGTGSTATGAVDSVAGNLHHTATLIAGGYAGAGLSFGVCATAAAHNAVQFSITGSLGGCVLEFQAQTYSDKSTTLGGGCVAASCIFPVRSNLAISPSAITVPFEGLTGGAPKPFNAAEIVGLQWQVTNPTQTPCTVDIRVDNIKFLTQ